MMDKGICVYFGYDNISAKKRLQMIKEAGFQSIITTFDKKFNFQNGSVSSQVRRAKELGLKLSSVHCSYSPKDLPNFWLNNKMGNKIEKQLIKEIKLTRKYNFTCLVVHTLGTYSAVGQRRLNNIIDVCTKSNVKLAIENIGNLELFENIFKNNNTEFFDVCYDSGHHNIFDREFDFLGKYQQKICTLHLHNNTGEGDQHTFLSSGTINWQNVAKKLAKTKITNLDSELLCKDNYKLFSAKEALEKTYNDLCNLEKQIESFKK